jgi:hypothetical protein
VLEINGNEIYVTRGDTAVIKLELDNYEFVNGDVVYFSVKKNKKDKEYVIQKTVTEFKGNSASVKLYAEDTDIEEGNYWYDIQCSLLDGRIDTVVIPTRFVIGEQITE